MDVKSADRPDATSPALQLFFARRDAEAQLLKVTQKRRADETTFGSSLGDLSDKTAKLRLTGEWHELKQAHADETGLLRRINELRVEELRLEAEREAGRFGLQSAMWLIAGFLLSHWLWGPVNRGLSFLFN